MIYRFFTDRPVFANVIAIITIVLGLIAIQVLPVQQYPEITPPTVRISTTYPGASASVVAQTIGAPLEEQVNGVENMLYMSSTSSSDGSYSLEVTFDIGTDLDEAQTLVQNRAAIAEPMLPEEVRRQGIVVRKQSPNIIVVISLLSDREELDNLFLANFATLRLRDELSRVDGVGEVTVFGTSRYSMRLWLDAELLRARGLSTGDVIAAVQAQNFQVAAGQIGQPPTTDNRGFQYTITALGRLSDVEQFERIIIKTEPGGRNVYLGDVARIELGSQTYDQFTERGGKPNANLGIYQLPGANALNVAEGVKARMEELAKSFPSGVSYSIPLDTTKFVSAAISEVYKTFFEAGILVLIVIVLFLQDWRAVLVPATTVPVTIIGAFFAMQLLGFSVNMLTLFGLVLAIGIVIDDAIVVVENAAHHIEQGMTPRNATIKAMDEVFGPIIGITLVLSAVFLPSAFLGGITGQFYRQFALTIAATAILSAINAVTLKPAQCASWLRPVQHEKNRFFRGFNRGYGALARRYDRSVRFLTAHIASTMLVFVALVVGTAFWYTRVPTGLLPNEDQGYFIVSVQLPDAASQQRTLGVMRKVSAILAELPGVDDSVSIGGLSLLDRSSSPSAGTMFVTLKPWDERTDPQTAIDAILDTLHQRVAAIQEAVVIAFVPPAIPGLGVRGGFQMQVEDREGIGLTELGRYVDQIIAEAQTQSGLAALNTTFRPGVPQLFADIDREKVRRHNLSLSSVFNTLQAYLGSVYVNDFNKFSRIYQVRVQADSRFRDKAEDIRRLEVRNNDGSMVPLGAVLKVERTFGPQVINRYNLYPSAQVSGEAAPGYSSGDAIALMEQIAGRVLPRSMGYDWTSMAYQEKQVGGEATFAFVLAILLVYLLLAAQYESWLLPAAVILVVPLGLLGSIAAGSLRGMESNIYTQVGIVLIIALGSKNAILIVEFARDLRAQGRSIVEAAVEAAELRFRPILMTSFAFILGVAPLVFAHGAGAAGQRALGTAVIGGMFTSTLLAVFFVPVFFVVFQRLQERWKPIHTGEPAEEVSSDDEELLEEQTRRHRG